MFFWGHHTKTYFVCPIPSWDKVSGMRSPFECLLQILKFSDEGRNEWSWGTSPDASSYIVSLNVLSKQLLPFKF